jgi:hypothetical protein
MRREFSAFILHLSRAFLFYSAFDPVASFAIVSVDCAAIGLVLSIFILGLPPEYLLIQLAILGGTTKITCNGVKDMFIMGDWAGKTSDDWINGLVRMQDFPLS